MFTSRMAAPLLEMPGSELALGGLVHVGRVKAQFHIRLVAEY